MYCKKCGKKLPDGSKFCGVCGAKQDSQIVQQSLKSKELKRSQYGLKTPILLIGIFIAIGVIVWGGYQYKNQPEKIIVGVWDVIDVNLNRTGDKIEFRKDGTLLTGSTVGYWSFVEKDKLRLTSWSEEHTYECTRTNRIFIIKELMLSEGNNVIYLEKE